MAKSSRVDPADAAPEVSVVVPLFNEEENVGELYRRLTQSLTALEVSYELVLVNDGSRDRTAAMLDALGDQDAHVVAIHLSRNFGHQAAVSAGIDHTAGRAVIVMDGDLQDPPEVLGQFLQPWREGHDVVYAVRTKRKEHIFKRAGYALFYRLLRRISDLDIPLDSGDFCLMDRKVVEALKGLPERTRFVRGLRTFVGFRQVGVRYERSARSAGEPKYSFQSLVRLAIEGIVSFSRCPLSVVTYLGLASMGLALTLAVWVVIDALYNHGTPRGWASTILIVLLMSSIQLISLGIIGEYIHRIFIESKGRPTYIVGRISRHEAGAEDQPLAFRHEESGFAMRR